ncbi:hypothetical protein CVT25_014621 [Psilocybe cyanescens]|uniref:Uncharacterized protein n=1 Tax=Psilocybe cyanescens TaxID=93625 RepID=A0A409WU51_PSICY|nr:hypothetical protein CVT25_014621 [Psilocybe cyanescens]
MMKIAPYTTTKTPDLEGTRWNKGRGCKQEMRPHERGHNTRPMAHIMTTVCTKADTTCMDNNNNMQDTYHDTQDAYHDMQDMYHNMQDTYCDKYDMHGGHNNGMYD